MNNIVQTKTQETTPKELVMSWFAHIAQMADDHKNQNGDVMSDYQTFLEIKALANRSKSFIDKWYNISDINEVAEQILNKKCYNCKEIITYTSADLIDDIFVKCPDCGTIVCIFD